MNKDDAKKLIQNTLQNTFSKERFLYFVKNLLNEIDETKAFHAHGDVLKIYRNFVKTYERLGTFTDPAGKKIDILIVYLQKETSIDKARTAQRNFIAQYLKDRGEKDAGLIAFVSPNLEDWRFSFVKMEYKFIETPTGKVKAKESFTPAKRYSFLVGPHEASHTAQSRMLPVILNDATNPTLEEIEDIFSVEKVTKEFFEEYKKLFLNLVDEFTSNAEFKQRVVEEHKIAVADFVKKLMGQIVFLYFLQKKGWLGVKLGERWGSGDKKFMRSLFDKEYCDYKNYFNDILEPLFYDTLNKRDRGNSSVTNDQSYSPLFKCRIPYLNGGLFTPVYDWQKTKILIENKFFKDIFDVFDTFNFTVFESDPIEKEVAVDPEMLGKVFENLLEVKDRKSKGAYYTPREIVHYMCQESLINYLISQSGFSETRIRNLMKAKDQGIGRTEKQIEFIENSSELKEIAIKVNTLLKEVKICDPAVGSGAFPMGLLKEISTTRFFLNKHFLKEKNKYGLLLTEYDIKKETLENCIYGVDIDPGAVEIARLRFWLSLVVEHDIEEIEPLPNLDYKIMQGNSLIELYSPNLTVKTDDENRNKLIDQLKTSKAEYFNLSDTVSKNKKREEINLLVRAIINYDKSKQRSTIWQKIKDIRSQMGLFTDKKVEEQLNIGDITSKEISKEFKELNKIENVSNTEHFEWHLHFNEVFEKGGFDIVIANPPYVEFKNLPKDQKIKIENIYECARGKYDLYIPFIELAGRKLIRKNGYATFICPTRFIKRDYGYKLREILSQDYYLNEIVDFTDLQIFSGAITYTGIISFNNRKADYVLRYKKFKNTINNSINLSDLLSSKDENKYIEIIEKKKSYLNKNPWDFNNEINSNIFSKIRNTSIKLRDLSEGIYQGVATGKDEVFILNLEEIYKFNIEKDLLQPFLMGKDIGRYQIFYKKLYLLYPYTDDGKVIDEEKLKSQYSNAYKYLLLKRKLLKGRGYFEKSNKKWYELWNQRNLKRFKQTKIITLDNARKNSFYLDNAGYLTSTTAYSIILKNKDINHYKTILALLNSRLLEFIHHKNTIPQAGGFFRYQAIFIEGLPIKIPDKDIQFKIIELVDNILDLKRKEGYSSNLNYQTSVEEYEKQIDQIVYKLYGLTPKEIEIIEGDDD
jgi:hypothetical protein